MPETMDLGALVTLQTDVVPYLLDLPVLEESAEIGVLVVSVRPGGLLLAMPLGVVDDSALQVGNAPSLPGLVGPSTVLVVPSVILENGVLPPTGADIPVLVVDMSQSVLPRMRPAGSVDSAVFSFEEDLSQTLLCCRPESESGWKEEVKALDWAT